MDELRHVESSNEVQDNEIKKDTQYNAELFSAIFIFILIISCNFLTQLFPCKVQYALKHNMMLKHVFGFFTLFFFGILAIPELANVSGMMTSLLLYLCFLINAKTKYEFWIAVVVLFAVIYMLHIVKREYDTYINDKSTPTDNELYKKRNIYIESIQDVCMVFIVILTLLGMVIHLGEKKLEYGKKFKYSTFFLGKPVCNKIDEDNIDMMKALKAAFTK